jgi:hypothetical protein
MIMIEIPEKDRAPREPQGIANKHFEQSRPIRRGCIGANDRVRQSHGFAATATLAMDHDSI